MKYLIRLFLLCAVIFNSCATSEKIVYFQDAVLDQPESMDETMGIVIQPKDMLSIVVSSKDPELAVMFNLPVVSYQAGAEQMAGQQRLMGYVVDNEGYIDFPVLGGLRVSGMTRWQVSEMVKDKLIEGKYILDPVVTVQFMNFRISVMGEVNTPGTYDIDGDRITLLQALSKAHDLTIHGMRDNVSVIREKDGQRIIYKVDLKSVDLFDSPAYYLQQNDIVYVAPSRVRAGQSTINENYFKSASFWMSLTTLLATVAALVK